MRRGFGRTLLVVARRGEGSDGWCMVRIDLPVSGWVVLL